jgi:hypothetical protein
MAKSGSNGTLGVANEPRYLHLHLYNSRNCQATPP